ncbi:hypothetical protein HXX76_008512 [Chlamydomonas incerta]|uniref:Serine aminopeptidase S33 domain-containing protein n=1 Tax=Chlamydomonas incerta TaxID=51695 RepID=A0A835T6N0_CHLIN|nr:hypothetical protein HXX76_008512 [Chlamydomonas incerta]|eukprot:KAG2433455.1 hypothetical protein HXX76_008512 [Chlamydomonas incerta]
MASAQSHAPVVPDSLRGDMMGGLQPRSSDTIAVDTCGGAQLYWEEYGPPTQSGSSSSAAAAGAAAGPPAYGKRLLLINGANGKIPFLGHAIQRFVRLGYTVLVHEARGVGRSSAAGPPGRQTTRLLAADAQAVADGVWGADSRFHLLGASLGGMVAQELVYRLVRGGAQDRLLGALLLVTDGGQRWRPLPWRRAGRVRRLVLPQLGFREDDGGADFRARFSPQIAACYSAAWLDGPAPPLPGSTRGGGGDKPAAAPGGDGAVAGAPAAGPVTRRQVVTRLWCEHWRQLSAMRGTPEDVRAVTGQMSAQYSHFLGPRRAALIRRSGVRLGVGVSSADCFYPEPRQRQLAEALGAEVHRVGAGHADCLWLDGVGLAVGAALAVFRDSRV